MARRRVKYGYRKNGTRGRGTGRYALTPKRRQSILKAQRISARKKKKKRRDKDTVGYWIGRGVKKVGNKGSLGVAGQVADLKELNDAAVRAKKRRRQHG